MFDDSSSSMAVATALHSQLEIPRSNPVLPCKTFGNFFILHCSSSLSCMNEYLAIDSGRYLCKNNLHALIAACSVREVKCEALMIGYCAI